jgi:hypothetical protein
MPKKKTRPLTAKKVKDLIAFAQKRVLTFGDGYDVEVDPFPFREHRQNLSRGDDAGYWIRAWVWLPD